MLEFQKTTQNSSLFIDILDTEFFTALSIAMKKIKKTLKKIALQYEVFFSMFFNIFLLLFDQFLFFVTILRFFTITFLYNKSSIAKKQEKLLRN